MTRRRMLRVVLGVLIERAQRGVLLIDALFGIDEEEGSSADGDQGKQATRQPKRA